MKTVYIKDIDTRRSNIEYSSSSMFAIDVAQGVLVVTLGDRDPFMCETM